MWEDVHRLCANTTTFYTRDLSIYTFWYLRAVLEPDHQGYWGTMKLYSASVLGISLCIHGCFIDIFPNLLLSFPFRKTILLLKSFSTLVLVFELYKKNDGRGLEVVAFISSSSEVERWTSLALVRCFFTMASSLSWNLGNG